MPYDTTPTPKQAATFPVKDSNKNGVLDGKEIREALAAENKSKGSQKMHNILGMSDMQAFAYHYGQLTPNQRTKYNAEFAKQMSDCLNDAIKENNHHTPQSLKQGLADVVVTAYKQGMNAEQTNLHLGAFKDLVDFSKQFDGVFKKHKVEIRAEDVSDILKEYGAFTKPVTPEKPKQKISPAKTHFI